MDYTEGQAGNYATLGAVGASRPRDAREVDGRLTRIERVSAELSDALNNLRDRIDPQPRELSDERVACHSGLCGRLGGIEGRLQEAAAILKGIEELI